MALVGLIFGILYSFGGAIIDVLVSQGWITTASTPGVSWGTALAFLAIIGMPIIFATFGFIAGAIGAFLYNSVAGKVGGWDDKGNGPNDLTWTFWRVSVVGGAMVGAIVGAIGAAIDHAIGGGLFVARNDLLEAAFEGVFWGTLIGGSFLGSALGIVRHHLR